MKREDFDRLAPADRAKYVLDGGIVTDPEPEQIEREELPDGKLYRSDFENLPPYKQAEFVRSGGIVV